MFQAAWRRSSLRACRAATEMHGGLQPAESRAATISPDAREARLDSNCLLGRGLYVFGHRIW